MRAQLQRCAEELRVVDPQRSKEFDFQMGECRVQEYYFPGTESSPAKSRLSLTWPVPLGDANLQGLGLEDLVDIACKVGGITVEVC